MPSDVKSLDERVREMIGERGEPLEDTDFSARYHEQFRQSGIDKANEIIAHLSNVPNVDLSRCAYVSIGGSTGAEIAHVMESTPIRQGILLEYDGNVVPIAQEYQRKLKEAGKELLFEIGDATQKIASCGKRLRTWRKRDLIDGVICSAQAVLHELPYRSPNYEINHLLPEIFWDFVPCLFYSREPCRPAGWPDKVKIEIPGLGSPSLEALANDVAAYRRMSGLAKRAGPNAVIMPADLAVETLFKWFHNKDYRHEIQEQLTWTSPEDYAQIVRNCLEGGEVTFEALVSNGFRQHYVSKGVRAFDLKGTQLGLPLPFVRIVGIRTVAPKPLVVAPVDEESAPAVTGETDASTVVDPSPIMDAARFKALLEQSEGPKLDYKQGPYRLDDDGSKASFVKDILALANTNPPDSYGYIVIGVKDDPATGSRELVGVSFHPDDNELQQLVKDKVSPCPDFVYTPFVHEGRQFGLIRVSPGRELCQATRTIGSLRAHVVYTRKGSRNSEVTSSDLTDLFMARAKRFALADITSRADEVSAIETGTQHVIEHDAPSSAVPDRLAKGDRLRIRLHTMLNQKWRDPLAMVRSKMVRGGKLEPIVWPVSSRDDPEAQFSANYAALCIPSLYLPVEWHTREYILSGAYWGPMKAYAVGRFVAQNKDREIEATVRAIGRKNKPYLYLGCADYDAYLQKEWPYYRALEIALRRAAIAVDPEISVLPGLELRQFINESLLPSGQLSRLVPDDLRNLFEDKNDPEAVAVALECLIQEPGRGRLAKHGSVSPGKAASGHVDAEPA